MAILYEDGTEVEATEEVSVGGFAEPIPHNTVLICRVLGVMYAEGKEWQNGEQADDTLNIDLEVIESGKYKGRIVTQKLKMWDTGREQGKPPNADKAAKNRKKAVDFLCVYDTLAGGKIRKHRKQWHEIIDEMTEMLADTDTLIKFGDTGAMDTYVEGNRKYQYVQSVSRPPAQGATKPAATGTGTDMPPAPPRKAQPAPTPTPVNDVNAEFDDDIPF